MSDVHKCVLITVAHLLGFRPGQLVLDWGSGCGHKLTWAAQLFGVDGLGIDNVAGSVTWAREHGLGHFCEADGRFLSWLPDDFFDAVISYAALMHLAPTDQCAVVTELAGKVREGGRLWFGWNEPGIYLNGSELEALVEARGRSAGAAHGIWADCFREALETRERWATGDVRVAWETEEEALIFPSDMSRIGVYLYAPPAHSLFVTRLPRGGPA
mmetsp:Transcript_71504/g.202814  ORF Transcript_71504/g.202814 Transcript_71504/m.202814 type:complete len:214 (+) Transcript_71504:1-642(+)